jgi:hypothetical protein
MNNTPPTITNLYVDSYSDSNAYLVWTETNVVLRNATTTYISGGSPNTATVSSLAAGSCTVTGVYSDTYSVTINVSNPYGSASASVTISIPCFLGFVKLTTRDGPVAAEDVVVGMEMLQPDGVTYSRVKKVLTRNVTEHTRPADARLFADPSEKMVVTAWHKIRFSDETEENKADEHPRLHEVFRELPFPVYHFHLEHYTHKILIHDTDIIAESFVPENPA